MSGAFHGGNRKFAASHLGQRQSQHVRHISVRRSAKSAPGGRFTPIAQRQGETHTGHWKFSPVRPVIDSHGLIIFRLGEEFSPRLVREQSRRRPGFLHLSDGEAGGHPPFRVHSHLAALGREAVQPLFEIGPAGVQSGLTAIGNDCDIGRNRGMLQAPLAAELVSVIGKVLQPNLVAALAVRDDLFFEGGARLRPRQSRDSAIHRPADDQVHDGFRRTLVAPLRGVVDCPRIQACDDRQPTAADRGDARRRQTMKKRAAGAQTQVHLHGPFARLFRGQMELQHDEDLRRSRRRHRRRPHVGIFGDIEAAVGSSET